MSHRNRTKILLSRRIVDELMLALDSCLTQMAAWDQLEDNREATRQAAEFGRRTIAWARGQVAKAGERDTE